MLACPFEDTPLAGSAAILCIGGLDVIRKEAWPFYRTSSGVRLCWEHEEPKGPKGLLDRIPSVRGKGVRALISNTVELIPTLGAIFFEASPSRTRSAHSAPNTLDPQGCLAHKKTPPPQDPGVDLCLWSYGGPKGGAFSSPCTRRAYPEYSRANSLGSYGRASPRSIEPPYRGTSRIRNSHPPRIAIGPSAEAYCRFLGRVGFL